MDINYEKISEAYEEICRDLEEAGGFRSDIPHTVYDDGDTIIEIRSVKVFGNFTNCTLSGNNGRTMQYEWQTGLKGNFVKATVSAICCL